MKEVRGPNPSLKVFFVSATKYAEQGPVFGGLCAGVPHRLAKLFKFARIFAYIGPNMESSPPTEDQFAVSFF